MKFLCLGNNTELTDEQTTQIAKCDNQKNHGLISDLEENLSIDSFFPRDGYYHTSVYDIPIYKLKKLIQRFDSLIILNQPIVLWSHPDSFYKTIDFALNSDIPVIWKNHNLSTDVRYWENLVKNNKSFCIFPFIELLAYDGKTTVCCRSNKKITSLKNLINFQHDAEYNKIRQAMMDGIKVPAHCSSCYKLESDGVRSARQQETVEWALRLGLHNVDDVHDIKSPAYIEVRPSNICNLQCRMCGPRFSNKIEKEFKKLGIIDSNKKQQYTGFEIVDFSNLKKLYVAGGEPTAMQEFYSFLEKCILKNNTDFEFLVNTNAVKIPNKLIELGKKFKDLQYTISIDGFGIANDYIRWGSKWDSVIGNTKKLQSQHKINFNVTLSIYGIFGLADLVNFLEKEFPHCLIHLQYAESDNDILNPFSFEHSPELINRLQNIKNTSSYIGNLLFKTFIDDVIIKSKKSKLDKKKLKAFFEYNDMLDKSRGSRLNKYIPEFEIIRNNLEIAS